MKRYLVCLVIICLAKLGNCQSKKQLDYQYFRDERNYFAAEVFRYADTPKDRLLINFSTNIAAKKIEKVIIKFNNQELKVKFNSREEVIKSDNPQQKFFPITINQDFTIANISCDAQIVFKLDDGRIYTLPFSACVINKILSKS